MIRYFILAFLIFTSSMSEANSPEDERRIFVLKDSFGRVIQSRNVDHFRERVAASERGLTISIQLNIGDNYDAFKMGRDEKYAQAISKLGNEARQRLIDATAGKGRVEIKHALDPLPWVYIEVDLPGFDAVLSSPMSQVLSESANMVSFLDSSLTQINAVPLHIAGGTGSGKSVAILDSGIERGHPMFAGSIVAEACFLTNTFTSNSYLIYDVCPNGYGSTSPGSAQACTTVTDCRHGTHVAGIAAGKLQYSSGTPLKGVAPSASIVAVRTGSAKRGEWLNGHPINYSGDDTAAALTYLYNNRTSLNLAAVNISNGNISFTSNAANTHCNGFHSDVTSAANMLAGAGIPVIAAAGTDNQIGLYPGKVAFPACIEGVVSVSSATRNGRFENGASANGAMVDLLAPGGDYPQTISAQNILSALPGPTYGRLGGSSMAAPHVAGAIAALRSGPWATQGYTVAQMINHLKQTGTLVSLNMDGSPVSYTHKLINLGAAIASPIVTGTPSAPTYFNVDPMYCYGSNEVSWGGSTGTVSHYELQGSSNASFTLPYTVTPSNFGTINVSAKTWLRVKACSGTACSAWKNGNREATFTSGCV